MPKSFSMLLTTILNECNSTLGDDAGQLQTHWYTGNPLIKALIEAQFHRQCQFACELKRSPLRDVFSTWIKDTYQANAPCNYTTVRFIQDYETYLRISDPDDAPHVSLQQLAESQFRQTERIDASKNYTPCPVCDGNVRACHSFCVFFRLVRASS